MIGDFRTSASIIIWLYAPIFSFFGGFALIIYELRDTADAAIVEYGFSVGVFYAIWLIVIGFYIHPSPEAENFKRKDYLPLSINNLIQTGLVVAHTLIYICLIIWVSANYVIYPMNYIANLDFSLLATYHATLAAACVAFLSASAYVIIKTFTVFKPIITNPKAFWDAVKINNVEEDKLNDLLAKHNIPKAQTNETIKKPRQTKPNIITQSYYSNAQKTVSKPSSVPFWATVTESMKILASIPKTILRPHKKKLVKTHYKKPKK